MLGEKVNVIQKFNPFRSPNWRYERVQELCDRSMKVLPLSVHDDDVIRNARTYHMARKSANPSKLSSFFARQPGMYYAFQIYDHYDDVVRVWIEARILARQTNEEIADKIGTLPDAIDCYEKLFFNVRDRIDRGDWINRQIVNSLLGMQMSDPNSLINNEMSLKFFGYYAGPIVLDFLISGWSFRSKPSNAEEFTEMLDEHMNTTLRRRSAEAAQQFSINKFNVMQVFETHTRIMEIQHSMESKAMGGKTPVEANILAMLEGLREATTIGGFEAAKRPVAKKINEMSKKGIILRDSHLQELVKTGKLNDEVMADLEQASKQFQLRGAGSE